MLSVRALAFDVFGTVVDWRSSIIREGELLGAAKGLKVDWPAFADAWRAGYRPAMDRVARGELAWQTIDQLHRSILDGLLQRFNITGLDVKSKDKPEPNSTIRATCIATTFVLLDKPAAAKPGAKTGAKPAAPAPAKGKGA